MRLRTLGVAAAAVLAIAGLTACRSNVGTAATVNGDRISESDVSEFITPKAQPINQQNSSGGTTQMSPRSFVLWEMINERFGLAILDSLPAANRMTKEQVDAQLQQEIGDRSAKSVAQGAGLKGYAEDFYDIVLRVEEIRGILSTDAQNGVDVQSVIESLDFPVTVNPRYGSWNERAKSFNGTAIIPAYLSAQPGGANALANQPAG